MLKKLAQALVIQDSANEKSLLLRWSLLSAAIARIAKICGVFVLDSSIPIRTLLSTIVYMLEFSTMLL